MKGATVNTTKLLAFALLVAVAAYGCSTSDDGDTTDSEQSEDELLLRRGSVDHAAIVEATTMMLAGGPADLALDPYNQADPFAIQAARFAPTFARRLAQFDAYDRTTDWSPEQARTWSTRVASGNYQVIDTDKPCNFAAPHTYLEIERAQLNGTEHATCGGRMPNEDALDVTLNLLIRGPAASAEDEAAIRDGVDRATKESVDAFPYLAEMNGL
jgi:hypothetical protein